MWPPICDLPLEACQYTRLLPSPATRLSEHRAQTGYIAKDHASRMWYEARHAMQRLVGPDSVGREASGTKSKMDAMLGGSRAGRQASTITTRQKIFAFLR